MAVVEVVSVEVDHVFDVVVTAEAVQVFDVIVTAVAEVVNGVIKVFDSSRQKF